MTVAVAEVVTVDPEWEQLILEALKLGITKKEIQIFLNSSPKS